MQVSYSRKDFGSSCHPGGWGLECSNAWKGHKSQGRWNRLCQVSKVSLRSSDDLSEGQREKMLFSVFIMSSSLWPHGLHHGRLPCPSLSHGVFSNPCPLSQWCHSTISPSLSPFSFCTQFFPSFQWVGSSHQTAKGLGLQFQQQSFQYSGLIYFRIDWFDLFAVQGLSRVFSSTTVQKHQFFGTQPSLWSNSHTPTWLLEKS